MIQKFFYILENIVLMLQKNGFRVVKMPLKWENGQLRVVPLVSITRSAVIYHSFRRHLTLVPPLPYTFR